MTEPNSSVFDEANANDPADPGPVPEEPMDDGEAGALAAAEQANYAAAHTQNPIVEEVE